MKIPSNVSYVSKAEQIAVAEAVANGFLVGNGPVCQATEADMQTMFGVKHVLLTPSCTSALEMAMMLLDIGIGDEVILPSFTFPSTANAIVLRGAIPIFVDIDPTTMNIDPEGIRQAITSRTKVIMVVHYAGIACDMAQIMNIAHTHDLYVVEDAAQGVDACYQSQFLGTIGHIGCYSFHATKNITCGEGGALLTNDDDIAFRAEMIQEKGTNRAAFFRGLVDQYTWVSQGSSYLLADMQAAMLRVQLSQRGEIKAKRQAIWEAYYAGLSGLEHISLPTIPDGCESNYHIFYFHTKDLATRTHILENLRAHGIGATFHYVPLHNAPFAESYLTNLQQPIPHLPHTEQYSDTLIRLPLYPDLSAEEVGFVIETTRNLLCGKNSNKM